MKEAPRPLFFRSDRYWPSLKAGAIEFGGSAIDCTVRNPSTTGQRSTCQGRSAFPKNSTWWYRAMRFASPVAAQRVAGVALGGASP
jgi:hypothetical protein